MIQISILCKQAYLPLVSVSLLTACFDSVWSQMSWVELITIPLGSHISFYVFCPSYWYHHFFNHPNQKPPIFDPLLFLPLVFNRLLNLTDVPTTAHCPVTKFLSFHSHCQCRGSCPCAPVTTATASWLMPPVLAPWPSFQRVAKVKLDKCPFAFQKTIKNKEKVSLYDILNPPPLFPLIFLLHLSPSHPIHPHTVFWACTPHLSSCFSQFEMPSSVPTNLNSVAPVT